MKIYETRMHTTRSSSHPGGGLHQAPHIADPPGPDPSRPGTPREQTTPRDQSPPVNRMTDRCKNITLLQTSFAGGNKTKSNQNRTKQNFRKTR